MSIRTFAPLAFLFAGLFLAGCDSSSSSPTDHTVTPPSGSGHTPNGTLKANGKSYPVWVSALYDDTSLALSAMDDLVGGEDTGWIVTLETKPSQGSRTYVKADKSLADASYQPPGIVSACVYAPESGTLHIDSWAVNAGAQYKPATMSGGATMALVPWTDGDPCPNTAIELTFTNAIALTEK